MKTLSIKRVLLLRALITRLEYEYQYTKVPGKHLELDILLDNLIFEIANKLEVNVYAKPNENTPSPSSQPGAAPSHYRRIIQ